MSFSVGIVKESAAKESRVAGSPVSVKKLTKRGIRVLVEHGAGKGSAVPDADFTDAGAEVTDRETAFGADVVFKVQKPDSDEIALLKKGALLFSLLDPFSDDGTLAALADAGVTAVAMELVPRISRAQSMDVLSSQANIAGYCAVLESTRHYGKFLPLMMTSAGTAKPAKVVVLGVGVAGLQAIATAKRLGAQVSAFDVRQETREQVLSLGAKFIDIDVGEEGSGEGGYAKELSEEGKKRQQALLAERLKDVDIIITTAQIPGRPAPILVTEETVTGMRPGSVIVDMAAGSGGNCPLSKADKVVVKNGVTIVGKTNYPAEMPGDASLFFGNNLLNLLELGIKQSEEDQSIELAIDMEDEIFAGCIAVTDGEVRFKANS